MTSFSFFKYFDAFELDVNVVNFVYYGKTRMMTQPDTGWCLLFLTADQNFSIFQNVRASPTKSPGLESILEDLRLSSYKSKLELRIAESEPPKQNSTILDFSCGKIN